MAIVIKLDSPGAVLFKQKRAGLMSKPFDIWKFRSMVKNAEILKKTVANQITDSATGTATNAANNDGGKFFKNTNDPRITKVGRILRKTSLDEFPQFINVLKGEMSLVGPRPHMVKHTDDYSQIVDQYMIRHFLKPGITGWAQINGLRGEITEPKQIKLRVKNDLWYLENWNIWLDIKILFLTIYTICKGDKKAY
jgi:putative colanic acid biosynthesis UDP-glucose lipid carrier transferase